MSDSDVEKKRSELTSQEVEGASVKILFQGPVEEWKKKKKKKKDRYQFG